jgi:uncharacterized protein YbaP (TraB family)
MGFGVDAVLSVLDEVLTGVPPLVWSSVAATTLLFVPLAYAALALSSQIPIRIFLPLLVTAVWLKLGAAPLVLWTGVERLSLAASLVQLAAAAAALLAVRRHSGGQSWLLLPQPVSESRFSRARFATLGIGGVVVGPLALVAYGLLALASFAHALTGGFLTIDLQGVELAERTYREDGREIRLVGMMHVGEAGRYESLYDSFAREGTVVLEEGVTDEKGLLENIPSYEKMAGRLGLRQQSPISRYFEELGAEWPHVRHADIDAAELSAETIELIERMSVVWSADDPIASLRASRSASVQPDELQRLMADLIDLRNRHLLGAIDEALDRYPNVVVPWGALHMPGIEEQLLARGFRTTGETAHRFVTWSRVGETGSEPVE